MAEGHQSGEATPIDQTTVLHEGISRRALTLCSQSRLTILPSTKGTELLLSVEYSYSTHLPDPDSSSNTLTFSSKVASKGTSLLHAVSLSFILRRRIRISLDHPVLITRITRIIPTTPDQAAYLPPRPPQFISPSRRVIVFSYSILHFPFETTVSPVPTRSFDLRFESHLRPARRGTYSWKQKKDEKTGRVSSLRAELNPGISGVTTRGAFAPCFSAAHHSRYEGIRSGEWEGVRNGAVLVPHCPTRRVRSIIYTHPSTANRVGHPTG